MGTEFGKLNDGAEFYRGFRVRPFQPKSPEVGHLIEIDRKRYQHWAVYIGNDEVVHKTSTFKSFMSSPTLTLKDLKQIHLSIVIRDTLSNAANGCPWVVNNKLGPSLLSSEEIRNRALDNLGRRIYCPFVDNCEHFVNYIRYNYKFSFQAEEAAENAIRCLCTQVVRPRSIFASAMMGNQSLFSLPKSGTEPWIDLTKIIITSIVIKKAKDVIMVLHTLE